MPFGKSKGPLPTRSLRSLRAAVRSTSWLQLQKKDFSSTEAESLVTQLWSPRFVTMQCLCSQLCYETAANQRTLVEIELLATAGWKWGCQPFSCRCSLNVTHCRKDIFSTCLCKESIPSIPFGISKHPLPTRSRFLRATVRSTSSALWLDHAHPFVAAAEKSLSHAEKQRVCTHLWSPRFVTSITVIVSKTWTAGC